MCLFLKSMERDGSEAWSLFACPSSTGPPPTDYTTAQGKLALRTLNDECALHSSGRWREGFAGPPRESNGAGDTAAGPSPRPRVCHEHTTSAWGDIQSTWGWWGVQGLGCGRGGDKTNLLRMQHFGATRGGRITPPHSPPHGRGLQPMTWTEGRKNRKTGGGA